jgi:hypothetical protein
VSLDVVDVLKASGFEFRLYAMEGVGDAASDEIIDTIEIYEISDCDNLCGCL